MQNDILTEDEVKAFFKKLHSTGIAMVSYKDRDSYKDKKPVDDRENKKGYRSILDIVQYTTCKESRLFVIKDYYLFGRFRIHRYARFL